MSHESYRRRIAEEDRADAVRERTILDRIESAVLKERKRCARLAHQSEVFQRGRERQGMAARRLTRDQWLEEFSR